MLSDPRIGLRISLLVFAAAVVWLLVWWFAADELWRALGDGSHVVTLFAFLALIASPFVAHLFYRYARVKADLLAGRNVIARWKVDPARFQSFSTIADTRERAEKRGMLYVMFTFIALIFGGIALLDPGVAPAMLTVAVGMGLILAFTLWLNNRIRKRHLQMRSGEIIVGTEGLLVNDVLHVWSAALSWLVDVKLEDGQAPALAITYAFWGRYGPQLVGVTLPIDPQQMGLARTIKARLHRTEKAV